MNEQSAIIKELTDKYCKFNNDKIIEKRIKQSISIIKADDKKVLDDIYISFTELKTYTIALKKCFDTSHEEVSILTMKLNQAISDNTIQTELWQKITIKEDMYEIEVINVMQKFQHEFRDYQRYITIRIKERKILLNTLPRTSTPLNQNEGIRNSSPQVLNAENSQINNEFSTSFHNLEPSMSKEILKEVPKLIEWPHFSGEGEYDHMEIVRGIEMIKEYFELPDRLVTTIFNTLFRKPAHIWYINLRQRHGHQS
ncbi:hypothetical protein O181_064244 [Austropuccinia psidii MF-1]|uniref:Uncharacterized protein n=1 Tax=Austropuccinia psidii MF-1 TaxID=1389203 RepID=A0A9Q3I3C0_9BASI|nr:hypothetical protein [Austropuccinia psidii MF-1]